MFEKLTEKIEAGFKKLKGQGRITEINIAETMKEIRKALTDSDVDYKVAQNFVNTVKQKALGQNVINALKPKELMVKIVHDEMTHLMGDQPVPLKIEGKPALILLSGLQGSGKTTFAGKLAKKLKAEKNMRPLLVACDVYRPAAIDQLKALAATIDVDVYTEDGVKDPVGIAKRAVEYAKENKYDLVIVDTAGRLAVDEQMMDEIEAIKKAIKPAEILFVVDSMTGQDAVNTARTFNERLDFGGVILTKLDGDARGGAAFAISSVVNKPIKFIGTGETLDGIDVFYPERMAKRILGMGDIVTLVETIQKNIDEKEAEEITKKALRNQFTFNDFLKQINQVKKMGDLKSIASMIPGLGKALKDVEISNDAFKGIEAIIQSMTPYEREHPQVIKGTRVQRIANGSGTKIQDVNRLLKQFEQIRKMMHDVSKKGNNPRAMMAQMQQMRRANKNMI